MYRRARLLALAAILTAPPHAASAQIQWQPTAPPLVTAENTVWFQATDPIDWNGDVYYPVGAVQAFNAYQMVRSGSYRGIPLYIDATLEPYSIVYVPLSGGRMQPYERRRTGILAGTTGSRAPSLPTDVSTEAAAPGGIAQAPAPPSFGPSRSLDAPAEPSALIGTGTPTSRGAAPTTEPGAVGTSGRTAAVAPPRPVTSVNPPTGANTIWITFDGRRWVAAGNAIDYDASILEEIGSYQGWTVYRRKGDPTVIYVPAMPGRLSAYKVR
jgi:hypothetical protein